MGQACNEKALYTGELCLSGGSCFQGVCAASCVADEDCMEGTCERASSDTEGSCAVACEPSETKGEPPENLDADYAVCDTGFWGYDYQQHCSPFVPDPTD